MKNNSFNIHHVIFNCDEVLIDHLTIFISVLIDITESHGLRLSTDEAIKLFSHQNISETIGMLEEKYHRNFPKEMEHEFRTRLEKEWIEGILPLEGTYNVLSSLPVPFYAISKLSPNRLKTSLEVSGLSQYFHEHNIFNVSEVGANGNIYVYISKKMGFRPCESVIVEGTVHGVKTAVQNGFRVYALTNGFNQQELEEAGATVFDLMWELSSLLGFDDQTRI